MSKHRLWRLFLRLAWSRGREPRYLALSVWGYHFVVAPRSKTHDWYLHADGLEYGPYSTPKEAQWAAFEMLLEGEADHVADREWVYVTVDVLRMTDKALLVRFEGGAELWLPKSQVSPEDLPALRPGDSEVEFAITEWIAREKGIEVD